MTLTTCPYIILLSGTPGTGKTSISNSLSKKSGWIVFSLGGFILENQFYLAEQNQNTKSIDIENASIASAKEIVSKFMNYEVIVVDSHYADIIMDGFESLNEASVMTCIQNYLNSVNIIGLVCRCHPDILSKRLAQRQYPKSKIIENVQAEILSESTQNLLEVLEKGNIYEVDTSKIPINEVILGINQFFVGLKNNKNIDGIVRPVGEINWIAILNDEGTLNSYFKEDYGEKYEINLKDVEDI